MRSGQNPASNSSAQVKGGESRAEEPNSHRLVLIHLNLNTTVLRGHLMGPCGHYKAKSKQCTVAQSPEPKARLRGSSY